MPKCFEMKKPNIGFAKGMFNITVALRLDHSAEMQTKYGLKTVQIIVKRLPKQPFESLR
jgi:hypothetical protein